MVSQNENNVNTCMELLKKLQDAREMGNKKLEKDTTKELLSEIRDIQNALMSFVPQRYKSQVVGQKSPEALDEIPLLFGRCFNLSLNMKTLKSNSSDGGIDLNIASRVISDLAILEVSVSQLNEIKSDNIIDSFMTKLSLKNPPSRRPRFGL